MTDQNLTLKMTDDPDKSNSSFQQSAAGFYQVLQKGKEQQPIPGESLDTMAQFKAQMLWGSIEKGDLTVVHGLLESGNINLEERDEAGRTFLMVASEKGELNIVRELLEAGVDPNAVDNESWSALLCASKEGYLEIVIELLEHGAELEHKDLCGWTSLMWASYKGRIMVVQELLDRGALANTKADHHMTSLAWAAGRGHTEVVQMLISKGAKVNTADKYGTTPLIWACRKGYIEIVDALLAEGANVDASGMNSWTPLLVATKGGHFEVVHSVLQQDPNVNATDKDGQTSLAIAAREGHVEIVKDLLSKGAYVNVPDRSGDSILIHAVKGGQVEVVKALLDKYVDVDVQGAEEKTALYWAVEKGYNEIVRLLLASQPDLEIRTKDDDTALLRAVRSRNEECVRMLLDKGAKVTASDKRGDTALHIAIRARSKRITELLLRNPRNSRLLYRPNKSGETAYAMDAYHQRGILQGIHGHRSLNASDAENLLGYDLYGSALADILSDPSLTTPITVGLYAKWGSGKSFLISKLQSEMKSFTQQSVEEHFTLSLTVVMVMLFLSLVLGEALVLGVSLQVGIGVAVSLFLLQLIFCGVVMLCDQRYDMKVAVKISMVLGRRQRMMMLLLRMLFCNPRRSIKTDKQSSNQYCVRFVFSECTRLTSVGGEKALAAMIATLCQAVEREYGFIITRLFRVFKPADKVSKKGRFKSLCCVPYFLLVLFVLFCVAAGVALLVQFRIKEHEAVDVVLAVIAGILTLAVIGNSYTWAQTVMALVSPQKRRVLKAADQVGTLKMAGFLQRLKTEVELMSRMVMVMDSFTADQTRLVVIVDGLDTCEQEKVLQVLDTVKSLFSDDDAPFITILAVDPHIIIKGIEHNLRSTFQDTNVNGFDYLRNVVHLPFYLQTQGIRIQHQESLHEERDRTAVPKLGHQGSTASLESKREARRKGRGEGLSGSQPQMYASSFDLSNTFARSDYFSDINPRSMRRLMNIVSVTARLLRAYNIDFKWHRLAAWINIIEQWPYRVSWIIYLYEELDVVENSTSLYSLYQRILPRIPVTKESEPLLEIDRNTRKLDAFLSSQSPGLPRLNVADLRKFLPCTINLDPYLRKLIRDTEHQNEIMRQEMYPGHQPTLFPTSSGTTIDNLSLVSFNRPPPQGSSPSRFMAPFPSHGPGQSSTAAFGSMGTISAAASGAYMTQSLPTAYSSPSRPHPSVFFNDVSLLSQWVELDVEGVCRLLGALKGVTPDVLPAYTRQVQENNISGLVLQNCETEELRPVLQMRFGDWQLFKSAILSLREWQGSMPGPGDDSSKNAAVRGGANNSASQPSSTKLERGARGGLGERRDVGGVRSMQGRVVGPKGRRMRRNDSIVQQLSYEAAILHEALEEFSEQSDGDEIDVKEEEGEAPPPPQEDQGQQPLLLLEPAQPEDSMAEMAQLCSMITVLDAPADSQGTALHAHFLPHTSSSTTTTTSQSLDLVNLGSPSPDHGEHHHQSDSHSKPHNPFFRSLSTGIEKIARPFISVFDSHSGERQSSSRDEGELRVERLALLEDREAAVVPKPVVLSGWDRRAFSSDSGSPGAETRETPVTVETAVTIEMTPPMSRALFTVGGEESLPTSPTYSVVSETADVHTVQSQQQHWQQGPWQHHSQGAPHVAVRPSPDKDKESFV